MSAPPMHLILFDDEVARRWEPFATTRPAGELLFGVVTFRERAERVFRSRCLGHLCAEHLVGFDEPGAAPVLSLESVPRERARLFLLSRFVPEWDAGNLPAAEAAGPLVATDGRTVGWYAPPGADGPDQDFVLDPEAARGEPVATLSGHCLERVWHLVSESPDRIARDLEVLFPEAPEAELPPHVYRQGGHPLIVHESASIEPGSLLDTREGPIWIDRDASVRAFTRLVGPAYVGCGSVVLGGPVEAVALGPVCRVRGELAESVCAGYANKQHDGHIGHAYLGRWVNLGAETTNSDLKNDYGTIRIRTPDGEVDTGEMKLGSLLGDHVKTGIGLLLNTGTIIGAGCNLYGAAMPPTFVPPFSWGTGEALVEYRLDKFLSVAERAMARRGVELTASAREQLERAWHHGRAAGGSASPLARSKSS